MNTQAMNLNTDAIQTPTGPINHHPNANLLLEYASGVMNPGTAVAVSAHLSFCDECRDKVRNLENIGSLMLEGLEPTAIDETCFDSLMSKLDNIEASTSIAPEPEEQSPLTSDKAQRSELPNVVKRLVSRSQSPLKWKKLGWSLASARLPDIDDTHDLSLHRIKAGGKILDHDHFGDEYTLVLSGSFSDEDGLYQRGDFIHKQPGEQHRPLAAKHEDCLCLVVQEEPIKFTGIFTRWLNPLLKKPA